MGIFDAQHLPVEACRVVRLPWGLLLGTACRTEKKQRGQEGGRSSIAVEGLEWSCRGASGEGDVGGYRREAAEAGVHWCAQRQECIGVLSVHSGQ